MTDMIEDDATQVSTEAALGAGKSTGGCRRDRRWPKKQGRGIAHSYLMKYISICVSFFDIE